MQKTLNQAKIFLTQATYIKIMTHEKIVCPTQGAT